MANKRRKHQSLDFIVGGLKKIAYDPEVKGDIRLEALRYMMEIDGVIAPRLTGDSGQPNPPSAPSAPTIDPMLEALKAKHQAQSGGDNANPNS
jgi:hypothetical protein